MEGALQDGAENYAETPLQLASAAGDTVILSRFSLIWLPVDLSVTLYAKLTSEVPDSFVG